MCVSNRAALRQALLSYMFENAAASDTLEGIVEWWLLDRRIRHEMAEVKSVLDDLVARKLLLKRTAKDKRVHYRVNRGKEKQIRALLTKARG
jgi:hypothetical protein